MLNLNEKFTLLKTVQERDAIGSITQTMQEVGEKWCAVVESDGFFRNIKGGKKRVQTLTIRTWLNRDINHTYFVRYNGVEYNVVNAMHSRVKGITTIQCEFNN
ncbi:MAG: head-tail adaptor protein [Proteobacteria bacterium]|nr:head-tail adaptor protein [Pseudomonadota bacterium]